MALSFLYIAFVRLLQLVRLSRRPQQDLAVEVVMLRHEVGVLRRQVTRPALRPSDRAVLAGLSRCISVARRGRLFVRPETLLRWHRDLLRRHWTHPSRRPGRPALPAGTVSVVLRLANENPTWGYRRVQGEMARMGVKLAPSTVWAVLRKHGIDPAPREIWPHVGGVLTSTVAGDARLRLLYRRHGAPPTPLRAVLHRARHRPKR